MVRTAGGGVLACTLTLKSEFEKRRRLRFRYIVHCQNYLNLFLKRRW